MPKLCNILDMNDFIMTQRRESQVQKLLYLIRHNSPNFQALSQVNFGEVAGEVLERNDRLKLYSSTVKESFQIAIDLVEKYCCRRCFGLNAVQVGQSRNDSDNPTLSGELSWRTYPTRPSKVVNVKVLLLS